MKKLINAPDAVVADALRGVQAAHGDRVRVTFDPYCVIRADAPVQGKVGLISGGGSGHEPMHGGFVGPGMLDAACPGEVFTSPTPDQMLEATKAVNGGAGVVHIVKNYTGDVMNFDMAADMGKAEPTPRWVLWSLIAVSVVFTAWQAAIYPVPLAWGATFDPSLVERMAASIGASMRSVGIHQGLAPVLDVTVDPRWGRTEETIGEDPYLVGTVGTAYVRGLEPSRG